LHGPILLLLVLTVPSNGTGDGIRNGDDPDTCGLTLIISLCRCLPEGLVGGVRVLLLEGEGDLVGRFLPPSFVISADEPDRDF